MRGLKRSTISPARRRENYFIQITLILVRGLKHELIAPHGARHQADSNNADPREGIKTDFFPHFLAEIVIHSNNADPREGIKTNCAVVFIRYSLVNSNNADPREGIKTQLAGGKCLERAITIQITLILVRGLKLTIAREGFFEIG